MVRVLRRVKGNISIRTLPGFSSQLEHSEQGVLHHPVIPVPNVLFGDGDGDEGHCVHADGSEVLVSEQLIDVLAAEVAASMAVVAASALGTSGGGRDHERGAHCVRFGHFRPMHSRRSTWRTLARGIAGSCAAAVSNSRSLSRNTTATCWPAAPLWICCPGVHQFCVNRLSHRCPRTPPPTSGSHLIVEKCFADLFSRSEIEGLYIQEL